MTIDDPVLRQARDIAERPPAEPVDPADGPAPPAGADLTAQAAALIADMEERPWGHVSPSVYETGRVASLAPWLTGHTDRLAHLLGTQRDDGAWGPSRPGYALVPTLSATEALLSALCGEHGRRAARDVPSARLAAAADRGLRALSGWLDGELTDLPDMPAIELITPSLIASINRHLETLSREPVPGLEHWADRRLPLPPDMGTRRLTLLSAALRKGTPLPEKLWHALEVAGDDAVRARAVGPVPETGAIGAAPAATAAWLGRHEPADDDPARRYLETAVRRHDRLMPCATPITVMERSWVLSWLLRCGVPVAVPESMAKELAQSVGPRGAVTTPGLPADADTTGAVLTSLSLLGAPQPPDALWAYETETHFCTWQGEDGKSVTTNAHVLEAFGHWCRHLARHSASPDGETPAASDVPADGDARYAAAVAKVADWLCERQEEDGSWRDRWHASPYYATACCALALNRFGGPEAATAVGRAVDWVARTQRPDGSWGWWDGTAEETAYALLVLLLTGAAEGPSGTVAARGARFLSRYAGRTPAEAAADPPLWHDKDLYAPGAIIQAAVLSALYLAERAQLISRR
ncbi:hypothetical protein Arub01_41200 [Actinomadura rubrobrunea]|uniref:Squalene cyclase C-terminal domain-containing protein n=1 Tax=Actinomadura rubrobrunea TaxID=115335 RepID=A0A9W6PZ89_9ACTN|nr:prenyltransferase/squalene oxidase repeat-containing protein [Actinomadura rubrobrunea]GLW65876.1 hypothetical protein Arub01_41200 [Actinomadura rubrobrunea]